MNKLCGRIAFVAAIAIAVVVPTNPAFAAGSAAAKKLSFEWWQWVTSIPASENPMLDPTGEKCMVGQHGDIWFLAGSWIGSGITRTCAIPANVKLFFPVLNYIGADTPGQCGQGPSRTTASWRAEADVNMDAATNLSATLDGRSAGKITRVQSKVFALSVPEDNAFVAAGFFCPPGDPLVAGNYSPAVDDGYYVQLNPLSVGQHTLVIQAGFGGGTPSVLTYILEVEPVTLQ
jgi:hypothetical protein